MNIFSFFDKPQPSVAFSFHDKSIHWIAVEEEQKTIQVTSYGSELLGADIIDEYDQIYNDALLVERLRVIASKEKFSQVNVVIPDHQAVFFHTHVIKQPTREMNDVITDHIKTYCQAHQLLTFSEYVCEYDIILATEFGYDIHVTLVPQKYISHLSRLFKQAGMQVKHIETAHHAVARSCMQTPSGEGYIALSFGNYKTTVSLIHRDHLVAHQVLPLGAQQLLETVEKFLRVNKKESEKIIQKYGLLQTHPDRALLSELYIVLTPIFQAIDNQLIALGRMPYKSYGYRFTTRDIIVYGNGIWVKGLIGLISERSGLRTQLLDVWGQYHNRRAPIMNLPASETLNYAEALSLALVYLEK